MCKRHADADLKSRDMPAKVYTITLDTKGKGVEAAQADKRAGTTQTSAKPKKANRALKPLYNSMLRVSLLCSDGYSATQHHQT